MSDLKYCPICTRELSDSNDCWIPCQYEWNGSMDAYLLPLSYKQVLEKHLQHFKDAIKNHNKSIRELRNIIKDLEDEIDNLNKRPE